MPSAKRYKSAGTYIVGVKPGVNIRAFLDGLTISPMDVWDKRFEAELQPSQLEILYNQPEVQTIEPDDFIYIDLPRPELPPSVNPLGGPHDVYLEPGFDINEFLKDTQINGDVQVIGPTHFFVAYLSPEKLWELTDNPRVFFIKYKPPYNHQRIALPDGLFLEFMQEKENYD
ncbi:hypothetical protein H0H92_008390 [Tricholoma furcatifolium]|nr:hypothetical protein H0H92_008390 [Tricholoma furcatifolium]